MTFDEEEGAEPAPDPSAEPEPEPDIPAEGEPEPDIPGMEGEGIDPENAVRPDAVLRDDERLSWQDIVVVVRKPFLKQRRVELLPLFGITMNDNMIQHLQLGASLNYFMTDVLAVGIEGQYFLNNLREPFDLVARQARRLPTVNKYNFGGSLNFHYVAVYGKFAVFDKHLIHWETVFTAGVGATQSEVLPRDPALQPFKNILVTPNVGASMRFFLTKFMTVHVGIRDYIFIDKFEAPNRMEVSGDAAKDNASSALINHVMFQTGLAFWLPPTFEYTTFR